MQTDTAILFVAEVMHDARVIRMNAEHISPAVTSWLRDSIGRWEGDTLVVETKYFTPSDSGRMTATIGFLVSPRTVVTERVTRVSERELLYVFTSMIRPGTRSPGLVRRISFARTIIARVRVSRGKLFARVDSAGGAVEGC